MARAGFNDEQTINANLSNSNRALSASFKKTNTANVDLPPINYIPGYKVAEEERRENEEIRISNENAREEYINDLKEQVDSGAFNGATFLPSVDTEGNISWTNDKGLDNPTTRNIKGEKGETGEQGEKGEKGDTGATGADGYSPTANVSKVDDTATITITDKTGTTTATITDGTDGEDGADGYSPTATVSKSGKVATITITDINGTTTTQIRDGEDGQGSGDMLKATYDTNDNGIVDNAEKVNNHTVESDVPSNAVFTDTTYTAGTGIDITGNVISNTQTSAEWGNITGTLSNQTDLASALGSKANTSDLATVATSGNYNDLSNKPNFPTVIAEVVISTSYSIANPISDTTINLSEADKTTIKNAIATAATDAYSKSIATVLIHLTFTNLTIKGNAGVKSSFYLYPDNTVLTKATTFRWAGYASYIYLTGDYEGAIPYLSLRGDLSWSGDTATVSTFHVEYLRIQKPLSIDNTSTYTPTSDYNPATKKYVDDSIGAISVPEEVEIGSTQPTDPDNKLWIDTGEVGSLGSEVHVGTTQPTHGEEVWIQYENLFDINDIEAGKYISSTNGTTGNSSASFVSDYIPVKANITYAITYNYATLVSSDFRDYCFYNTSKTFLSGGQYASTGRKFTITPTQNGYVRFSCDNNYKNIKMWSVSNAIKVNNNNTYETFYDENNIEKYSTAETKIGTWIDGKPIYRKVYRGTLGSAGDNGTINLTSYNIDTITNMYGFYGYSSTSSFSTGSMLPINTYFSSSKYANFYYYSTNKTIYCNHSDANIPYILTLEYTKTTD